MTCSDIVWWLRLHHSLYISNSETTEQDSANPYIAPKPPASAIDDAGYLIASLVE